MTRKHFRAFAERILEIKDHDRRTSAAIAVADVCKKFNPAFDKYKFFDACNIETNVN